MRRILEGEIPFEILIALADRPWENDAAKDRSGAIMEDSFLKHPSERRQCPLDAATSTNTPSN
jgi:hypothetical protein